MRTLITGGTGFIGAYLAQKLIEEGERPVLLDPNPASGSLAGFGDHFEHIKGSVNNLPPLINAISKFGITRVFHFGGLLSLAAEENPWVAFDANVVGTYNVLEAARIGGVAQVVYSSTIATYSLGLPSFEVTDETIQRPTSMYGVTKVFGELLGRFYSKKFGLDFRGLRLPSVVGPGAKTAHMSIYNAWAIEEPLKGKPYELPCAPGTRCPAIYFKDAANAALLLSKADRGKLTTLIYNIAGIKPPFTAQSLVDTVKSRLPGARLSFKPDPEVVSLLEQIGKMIIDESAAMSEWGWEAGFSLESMVDDFIAEYQTNKT